jgi:hypothetical protein
MDESYRNREFVATSKFTIFLYSIFKKKIKKKEKILSIVVDGSKNYYKMIIRWD